MDDNITPEMFSELFLTLHSNVTHALYADGVDGAVEKLQNIVMAPDGLTALELSRFKEELLGFQRAADDSFNPAHPHHGCDVFPLWLRYHFGIFDAPENSERTLWTYIQHCPFGTAVFHDAIKLLVEYAMRRANMPLACHAAQLLLHHYAIINLLRFNPCTPVTYSLDAEEISNENMLPLCLPYWEAIEALETDAAQCWADILEITLENATQDSRKEYYYPKVLEALREHYHKTNDFSRLEWIKAYEYE